METCGPLDLLTHALPPPTPSPPMRRFVRRGLGATRNDGPSLRDLSGPLSGCRSAVVEPGAFMAEQVRRPQRSRGQESYSYLVHGRRAPDCQRHAGSGCRRRNCDWLWQKEVVAIRRGFRGIQCRVHNRQSIVLQIIQRILIGLFLCLATIASGQTYSF